MERRSFLKNTAVTGAAIIAAPNLILGKNKFKVIGNEKFNGLDNDRILIIIEMFGGNDGLNTVIPGDEVYDRYEELRPFLHVKKEIAIPFGGAGEKAFYLNPALVNNVRNDGFQSLFNDGRLAIIEGVGYDNPTLSHFRSQDIKLTGINSIDPKEKLLDGWIAKYFSLLLPDYPLEIPEHPIAIQLGGTLSLMLKSRIGHMGIALTDPETFYEEGQGLTPVESLREENSTFDKEFNFIHTIAKQSEVYAEAVYNAYESGKNKINGEFYSDGLSQKFRMISSLIAGGLKTKVYYVRIGNFDHHAQQASQDGLSGQHPQLLAQIAKATSEFLADAQDMGFADRVIGMTISEFGRRHYENGSRGTDHGTASSQFVWGNYAEGGFFGELPNLAIQNNENLESQFDFRRTYADIIMNWFDGTEQHIEQVFGAKYQPIGVIRKPNSVSEFIGKPGSKAFYTFPNPSNGVGTINFTLKKHAQIEVSIFESTGRQIQVLSKGYFLAGEYSLPYSIEQSGSYIVGFTANGYRTSINLAIVR